MTPRVPMACAARWRASCRQAIAPLALLLAALQPSARASIIHVPADQPTIQHAIVAAADHDTILVAPGVYHEAIDFLDKDIVLEGVRGAAVTSIDALGFASSAVTIRNGGSATLIQGFTITHGSGTVLGPGLGGSGPVSGGGGILVAADGSGLPSTALIQDCIITGNVAGRGADTRGGGVCVDEKSVATVVGCELRENAAQTGGGMSGVLLAVDCTVQRNAAALGGGAYDVGELVGCTFADNRQGGVVVAQAAYDCVFRGNAVGAADIELVESCAFLGNRGGGFVSSAGSTVSRSVFIGNVNPAGPAALELDASFAQASVSNCFFAHNRSAAGYSCVIASAFPPSAPHSVSYCSFQGDSIFSAEPLEVLHCIVRDPPAPLVASGVSWSDIEGGFPGIGNFDADPLFVDAAHGDLHLAPGSPCIDAGDPTFFPDPVEKDIDGEPRLFGPSVDMGADEVTP